jgi:hypothetical protein
VVAVLLLGNKHNSRGWLFDADLRAKAAPLSLPGPKSTRVTSTRTRVGLSIASSAVIGLSNAVTA